VALLVPLLGLWRPSLAFLLTVLGVSVSLAASVGALLEVQSNGALHYQLGGWAPPLGIEYVVDLMAAFVATVVTGVALLVIIAIRRMAAQEMPQRTGSFYGLVGLLLTGLTGMVVTGDLFNLFVFLEIASLASYALVFTGGPQAMMAGFRYLILGTVGGSFYLLGVGFLYFSTGSLNMADVSARLVGLEDSRAVLAGAVFIFVGLGLKMALFPLHLWLPDAYNHAPSSVNSLIAPIMTKVAAYAMLRMFLNVFPPGYLDSVVPLAPVLVGLGLVGVVAGSAAAMVQHDVRRMLAHSSVSQLALIAVGIGLATPLAAAAALLHVMNHAVMKACLFLVAANVRYRTGDSSIDGFAGLGKRMPVTMGAFTVTAIAMVGVPPTAGFFSKWYLAQAGIDAGNWAVVAVVLLSSLMTGVYMLRIVERAYFAPSPVGEPGLPEGPTGKGLSTATRQATATEAAIDMVAPVVILAAAAVGLGLANAAVLTHVLLPAVGG
jgi:multicomponent Na+:H+ antiporter subunit D